MRFYIKQCRNCLIKLPNIPKNFRRGYFHGLDDICKKCRSKKDRLYFRTHPRAQERKRNRQNLDYLARKDSIIPRVKKWYRRHRRRVLRIRRKMVRDKKMVVISRYGGRCYVCGENRIQFLCIDHVGGGGEKHRREIKRTGNGFYGWLIKQNFPAGYRVLCFNHNMLDYFKKLKNRNTAISRYEKRLKRLVFLKYGLLCSCCGVRDLRILNIDHIHGKGKKHLRRLGLNGGSDFYRWLRNSGFPRGFRTLCYNCNMAKAMYGFCHKRKGK